MQNKCMSGFIACLAFTLSVSCLSSSGFGVLCKVSLPSHLASWIVPVSHKGWPHLAGHIPRWTEQAWWGPTDWMVVPQYPGAPASSSQSLGEWCHWVLSSQALEPSCICWHSCCPDNKVPSIKDRTSSQGCFQWKKWQLVPVILIGICVPSVGDQPASGCTENGANSGHYTVAFY